MNKPEHTYCFYMTNGEHLMIDADSMDVGTEILTLHKNEYEQPFMFVYVKDLMAWEAIK